MTTSSELPRFRKPAKSPTATDLKNGAEWDDLVDTSLDRVTANAEKWRTGLAGFITIVTSLLLLKGPESVSKIALPWGPVVVLLLIVAVVLTVIGLWHAQAAAAPPEKMLDRTAFFRANVTVRAGRVAAARQALGRLRSAQRLVTAALACLVLGIAMWWLVPSAEQPGAFLSATLLSDPGKVICGTVIASEDGQLLIQKRAKEDPVLLRLTDLASVEAVAKCS